MAADGEPVFLNVYDLSQGMAQQLSMTLLGKAIEGIWHTGVVVFGREYYFGGGVQSAPAGSTPYGVPKRKIPMGHTQVPRDLFEEFLVDIGPRYTVETYSLLTHNCNNFSDEVCQFLTGTSVPSDIINLPLEVLNSPMGAMIAPMIERLETSLRYNQVPQPPHLISVGPRTGGSLQTMPNFSSISIPPSATTATTSQGATGLGASTLAPRSGASGTSTSGAASEGAQALAPKSPREAAAAAAEERCKTAGAGSIPFAVVPRGYPPSEQQQPLDKPDDSIEEAVGAPAPANAATPKPSSSDSAGQTGETVQAAKSQVHEEITREFSLLMAAGGLGASEAAVEALRRVQQRHGLGGATILTSPSRSRAA